jgi:hypothetical protein
MRASIRENAEKIEDSNLDWTVGRLFQNALGGKLMKAMNNPEM